ncbi:tyrosine-protein kinase CSK isoform X3 [Octopus vulgaris]|uniref:Tyrosine-protein kinase n=1 Tax=Octopus vulgaris TaxID=6645 RepID=A0AA36F2H5_OCTVU|nr:tyrosine-protein kinase CSK isoform X3 [Octopus vulgaris]
MTQLDALKDWRWFHGNITRQEAEGILKENIDGSFLIRESKTNIGEYSLSVYHQSEIIHYHIQFKNKQISLDAKNYFKNLYKLIEYYNCVLHLNICLTHPVCDTNSLRSNLKDLGCILNSDAIELKDFLDKGEFSEVYEACYNSKPVAVKKLVNMEYTDQFVQEANVMTTLNHRNVLQLIGVVLDKDVYLVLEYMDEGNLANYLRSRGRDSITEEWQLNSSFDICVGMEYLEGKHLVHCDLAARNILLSNCGKVKISDFGLSNHTGALDKRIKFPIKWAAPEAIVDRVFTCKCDVWSFGVLLWEIFSFGKIPYPGVPASDIKDFIEEGNRMDIPDECPSSLRSIILVTWKLNPADRPTFKKLLELMTPLFGSLV